MERNPVENASHRTPFLPGLQSDTRSASSDAPLAQVQLERLARELVQAILDDPWGEVSPSIYDTAQTCLLLPPALWPGESIPFLLQQQHDDGCWGWEPTPLGYKLVPTLAATACLLHVTLLAVRGEAIGANAHAVAGAARRGLAALDSILRNPSMLLPDTIAIELLIPALAQEITAILRALAEASLSPAMQKTSPLWQHIQACLNIQLPQQDAHLLNQVRIAANLGIRLPAQMSHCLEVLGSDLDFTLFAYDKDGLMNGSMAATAAMIARSPLQTEHSVSALLKVAARFHGALPNVYPVPICERAWAVFYLLKAGIPIAAEQQQAIVAYLQPCVGPEGVSFAPGMFPDGDDTGVALALLSDLGAPASLSCLAWYETDSCFRCYEGERTPSVGVNAHFLEAIGGYMRRSPALRTQLQAAAAKCSSFLLAQQRADGSWLDKWHASPYYATGCCVQALHRYGVGETAAAIDRALAWMLQTQRADGSWGVCCGTLEETSHALLTIPLASTKHNELLTRALGRGRDFLLQHLHAQASSSVRTPLWHGKELYEDEPITRAIVLSALYLCNKEWNQATGRAERSSS